MIVEFLGKIIELPFLLFGEATEEELLKRNGKASVAGKCIICNKDVWTSQYIIEPTNSPSSHEEIEKYKNKIEKCLHKNCTIVVYQILMDAMSENIKYRGNI